MQQQQQRVAVLSHVKTSSVPSSRNDSSARRIAWHGGKIVSNKAEAMQKFYQRKVRAGDRLTAQQIEAIQATLGLKLDDERAYNKSKIKLATYRPHAKVTAVGNHIVLKTGRVLGPKIDLKQKTKKTGRNGNAKYQAAHPPKPVTGKMSKQTETSSTISLEDKLGLPLRALVEGQAKRSSNTTRR
ncbi:unnamed protein product [Peronospora effusa]|uniref:Uncharacterized protein n=1 Tax=Peronospora effusa TaxID=542832 RepID=A0A3M6VNW2_9STRA|nr:hypothetical protein DD238_004806 [Peronospora effusa]RQM16175.1 hypothetical protein DD237_005325 [Peronospora effusa]CAI5700430.1 unnamed protein product [Peronospora effusa]